MNAIQNPTKDHHYVPVCYLKQFLNTQTRKVATLNVGNMRLKYPVKLKWYSPRQFCYIKDYYTISDELKKEFKDFNVYDALYIESELFGRLENSFHTLMDLLIKKRSLPATQALHVADLIIQIKLRNPYMADLNEKHSPGWMDEIYPGLEKQFLADSRFMAYSEEIKKIILQKSMQKTRESPLLKKRLQLFSLIQRNTQGSQANFRIRQAMLATNWVLLTVSGTSRFITTDNPGFAVDENSLHNIKLKGFYRFYFPLSPKHCLMFGDGTDLKYIKKRKI